MKNELLKRVTNKEDRMLLSNTLDKLEKHQKTGISTHTNFLDVRELKIVEDTLKFIKADYKLYTPHEQCEKTIIVFGEYEDFLIIYKIDGNFKHSEILGTLFSLGIDNNQIGDIFTEDDFSYIVVLRKLNYLYEQSLTSISNRRVKLIEVDNMNLREERFEYFTIIVPSYRLDCIVSKLANLGRNDCAKFIKNGNVLLNYQEVSDNKKVNIKDIISIRKVGKFVIEEETTRTKKDNYLITIKKYS